MAKINLLVVDISHHNKVTSFKKMYDSGIRGVIHKSTQGTGFVDKQYESRRKAATDAGMLWGAYHFADNTDSAKQVEFFLKVAAPDDNTLMALDYEPNGSKTMSLNQAKTFLTKLDDKLGRNNVLYSGNLIKEQLKGKDVDGFWKQHPLWLAHYSKVIKLPSQWPDYFLHQFSDGVVNVQGTKVDGLTGQVDRNHFQGSEAELKAQWVISTKAAPVAPPAPPAAPVIEVVTTELLSNTTPDSGPWWRKWFT
jgi:GH25 family lysozyme M1 (1,4-beta-N-acetylmuramidase)